MKIFITDQKKHFPTHLFKLKKHDIIPYQKENLKHKISQQLINGRFNNLSFDSIFDYKIFPSNILTAYPQWIMENRKIQVGDIIVQQINIPPFNNLSQRIIVGVKIKEVLNSDNCKGFSYETLRGHVEKGISTFTIEPKNNRLVFTIETYSAPANAFLNLFQPLSSLYQDYCTKKALINMEQILTN
jgi:hypothetical protein